VTSYTDDALFASPQAVTAAHQAITILMVTSALENLYLHKKGKSLSTPEGEILGVDSECRRGKDSNLLKRKWNTLGVIRWPWENLAFHKGSHR